MRNMILLGLACVAGGFVGFIMGVFTVVAQATRRIEGK